MIQYDQTGNSKPKINSFRDLKVWQLSHDVVLEIYSILEQVPKKEEFRIISQLIRCSISVPANIAEGSGRASTKELMHFLNIARGSNEEVRYFLILIFDLKYINIEQYNNLENKCSHVSKMITNLVKSLNSTQSVLDNSTPYDFMNSVELK